MRVRSAAIVGVNTSRPSSSFRRYLPRLRDVRPERRIAPAIENGQKLRLDVLRVKSGRLGELSQVRALVMQGGVGALIAVSAS